MSNQNILDFLNNESPVQDKENRHTKIKKNTRRYRNVIINFSFINFN